MKNLPVIDIAALVSGNGDRLAVASQLQRACQQAGFFYIIGHGVSEQLQQDLNRLSAEFFQLPNAEKNAIAMPLGGRAWRGFFPVGGELTSGRPDLKEGVYFGAELSPEHPLVKIGTPLHGPNLFPQRPKLLQATVLKYIDEMTRLSHAVMRGIALSLGLAEGFFEERYTKDPLVLFRIFHYPPPASSDGESWGVGEHTDYGVLTILNQDSNGGLEVKSKNGWIAAPPITNSFVCNIGDMLDRMTGGLYKSTPHRVRNGSGRSRLSFPFFFDPNFHAKVDLLPIVHPDKVVDDSNDRWDKANPHAFQGTYGEYLLSKVGKVFPDLSAAVLK